MSKRRRDRSRLEFNSVGDTQNINECDPILEDIAHEEKYFTSTGHFRVPQIPGATIIIDLEPDDPALKPSNRRRH